MLQLHARIAKLEIGMPEEHVKIIDNGNIVEIQDNGTKLVKLKAEAMSDLVTVDGFNIGGVQDIVIRDRQILSADGIFIIVMAINHRTGQLRKSPDIISRGFIYLREEREFIQEARKLVQQSVEKFSQSNTRPFNFDKLKSNITDKLRKLLLQKTAKRPLVIPVLIGI